MVSGATYTEDGYEQTFAVNHLAHFRLINLLLPHLARQARIVLVASDTHDPARHTGMPRPPDHRSGHPGHRHVLRRT